MNTRSAAAQPIARSLAVIALAWTRQGRKLRVRQREELRRALTAAGEFLAWETVEGDVVEVALKETLTLAKAGARAVADDLEAELKEKKKEMTQLQKAADNLRDLGATADFEEPIEFSYQHTARRGESLVTKTEVVTVVDQKEADDAADSIEKKFESWDKLRVQMIDELKQTRTRIAEMTDLLPDYTAAHKNLVGEVLQLLH